jgi:predicted glycosyltransferase
MLGTGPEPSAAAAAALGERCAERTVALPYTRTFRIAGFTPRLVEYVAASDAVVSRCGYNTVTEALSVGRRPIVAPLSQPNGEQRLRATLFERAGLLRAIHPELLSPEAVADALAEAFDDSVLTRTDLRAAGVDFGGLGRVTENFRRLIGARRRQPPR